MSAPTFALDVGSGPVPAALPVPAWPLASGFDRLYLGSAYCAHLLPSARAVRSAGRRADDLGVAVTWVTPPLAPGDVERTLRALEPALDTRRAEVLVNDWGLLRRLRSLGRGLRLRVGTLLHRQNRDPRGASIPWGHAGLPGVPDGWRAGSGASSAWRDLLLDLGVCGFDAEWPPHGLIDGGLGNGHPAVALHVGWIATSTGRLCVAAGVGTGRPGPLIPHRCAAPCRGHATRTELRWQDGGSAVGPVVAIERGNTCFVASGDPGPAVDWVERNPTERIVLAPEPAL